MLCLLAWAAGIVDAVSYLGLGRVFTAMMTGNTVLLALAIGQGESMAIVRSALALAGFSVGAATGAFIVSRGRSRDEWPPSVTAAFAFEALLLAGFTAVWHVAGSTLTTGTTNLLIVPEGGTNSFTVSLSRPPDNDLTVTTLFTSGDTDLSVVGGGVRASLPDFLHNRGGETGPHERDPRFGTTITKP